MCVAKEAIMTASIVRVYQKSLRGALPVPIGFYAIPPAVYFLFGVNKP
jgi:hypothetical protein